MRDVIDSSREVLMTDSQSEAALQDLLAQMQLQKEVDDATAARKALGDQAAFLAKNIRDPKVKVTTKGVQYIVLKEGSGVKPKAADKVQVHYVGTLLDWMNFLTGLAFEVPEKGNVKVTPVTAMETGWLHF